MEERRDGSPVLREKRKKRVKMWQSEPRRAPQEPLDFLALPRLQSTILLCKVHG